MAISSTTTPSTIDETLRAGIAAARAGRPEEAQALFIQIIQQDEQNIPAWLWLSSLVNDPEEQQICLENVLALEPDNELARKGLARLAQRRQPAAPTAPPAAKKAAPVPPPPPLPEPASVEVVTGPSQPAWLAEPPADSVEAVEPTASFTGSPADEFDNEFLCPYCASPTRPDDRRCQQCRKKLWVEIPRRTGRSVTLWLAIGSQALNLLVTIGGVLVVAMMGSGLATREPEVGTKIPPLLLWACASPLLLYQLAVLVGLYLRWKPVFYLYLVNAGLALLMAGVSIFTGAGVLGGGLNAGLALGMLYLVFRIEDDFFGDKRRILFRVDRDASGTAGFMISGRRYVKLGMWGMAALHFRRAAGWAPEDAGMHLALALAYANLKRYDQAEKALANARRLAPNDPQVAKLAEEIAARQQAAPPQPPALGPKASKYRRLKPQA